jgi:hypothetical protein
VSESEVFISRPFLTVVILIVNELPGSRLFIVKSELGLVRFAWNFEFDSRI